MQAIDGTRKIALDRAIVLLKAAAVPYAIRLPDGAVLGELEITPEKQSRRSPKMHDFVKLYPGYVDAIKTMKPADVLVWAAPSREEANAFRKAASSTASHYLGKGVTISTLTEKDGAFSVELMRVE